MDAAPEVVIGSTIGGVAACFLGSLLIVRCSCPTLFARYFGWRTDTVSFVPPESIRIENPVPPSLKIYKPQKEFSKTRRLT